MNVNHSSTLEDDTFENEEEENEYEKLLKRNEEAKLELLKELGALHGIDVNEQVIKPKTQPVKKTNKRINSLQSNEPIRKSPRLSKILIENASQNIKETVQELKEEPQLRRTFFQGPEHMVKVSDDMEDVKPSLQDLIPYFKEVPDGVTARSIQKSLDEFKNSLKKFTISPEYVRKVGTTKTHSLLIHPSESKLLIITGDAAGYLSFWDVENHNAEVEIYRPHKNPVFCVSLCISNPLKLFATAIDGVVRSCDLEKMEFNDIYVTEDHTTYHAQMSPYTLLVAHGCGDVGVVDTRESKNPTSWIECHSRSVRTIQPHPLNENEFVTSSGVGEVGIWDIRGRKKQKPLLLLPHPKGLKSAFFSPGGGMLLTSCNDDKIRIFAADKNYLMMCKSHNMQTGRWLRPFQAMWHPSRDDAFIIGSLNRPRQVDICGIHGLTLHSLKSPHLNTVLSNCHFHKSRPVIAGANSSGYVHVFKGLG
ncbi:hypothetical protein R5R35_000098 [Gryllus longicercus]|uniref:WD repeat-containing protein 76 n=1 Tax=Gryllus longicercus TaxID=2509291 RepID=A0AAN9VLA0_9ORTH